MGSGTRDLDTRLRRRRVYAKFDDTTVAVFELATMCSLGKNRGHWPDGLLIALTVIEQIRAEADGLSLDVTVGQLAQRFLERLLVEQRRRETTPRQQSTSESNEETLQ